MDHEELAAPLIASSALDAVAPNLALTDPGKQDAGSIRQTLTRQHSAQASGSPGSPSRSGIVFGSPRRDKGHMHSMSNPFADMPSSATTSPTDRGLRELMMPARTLEFQKHSPPSYSNPPGSVYAIPEPDIKESKWADESAYEQLDDEENDDVIGAHEDHEQLVEKLSSPGAKSKSRRRYPKNGCMSWLAKPYYKYPAAVLGSLIIAAGLVLVFFVVAFRRPEVVWAGNKSNTAVAASASGFNFTSMVHLDFKNTNLWGLSMTDIDITAVYNQTQIVGTGTQSSISLPLTRKSSRNPTLQLEMDFVYVSAEDPDHSTIKYFWDVCSEGKQLPLTVSSHGKVKIADLITIPMGFRTSQGYLECDAALTRLLVATLQMLSINIGDL